MNYAVNWSSVALGALARIWTGSTNRSAVTTAQATIDRMLHSDPHRFGTHEAEGLYSIDVSPLRAIFEIDDPRREVQVVAVNLLH